MGIEEEVAEISHCDPRALNRQYADAKLISPQPTVGKMRLWDQNKGDDE